MPMNSEKMAMPATANSALRVLACAALLLMSGCALLGGGGGKNASTTYSPNPRVQPDASWPTVDWQLSLGNATAPRMVDSLRIAVRPTPNEIQVYKQANWARTPTGMLEDSLMQTLEDSGRIGSVSRQGSGIVADYKLVLDLRRFESAYATGAPVPAATIEVSAKLLHARDQQVVAARTFQQAQPAQTTAVPDVVTAFEQALGTVSGEIAGWVLTRGDQHARDTTH